MKNLYYPPVGFYFAVSVMPLINGNLSFQSISGLSSEMVTENYRAGGVDFDYKLPVKTQYSNLVMKKGLWVEDRDNAGKAEGKLAVWFQETMLQWQIKPQTIYIGLLKNENEAIIAWEVFNAWPKKWSISDFNAEESKIAIETMEFYYDYFKISK